MLVCFVLWSRFASSFSIAMKFSFGDKAGTDLLVLKQGFFAGALPFSSSLTVYTPTELSLDSVNSGLGSPEPKAQNPRPQHDPREDATPLASSSISQIRSKALRIFRKGPKLSAIGSLNFSGTSTFFSLKVFSFSPKTTCVFVLKSGKEARNPDRALDFNVDIFTGDGKERLCSVILKSNSYTTPTTGAACHSCRAQVLASGCC